MELFVIFSISSDPEKKPGAVSGKAVQIKVFLFWPKSNSNRFQKIKQQWQWNFLQKGRSNDNRTSWQIFCFNRHILFLIPYMSVFHLTITTWKTFQITEVASRTKASKHKAVSPWKPLIRFQLRWNCFAPRKSSMHHTNRTKTQNFTWSHCVLKQLPELACWFWVYTHK